jgi:hypothetical protein
MCTANPLTSVQQAAANLNSAVETDVLSHLSSYQAYYEINAAVQQIGKDAGNVAGYNVNLPSLNNDVNNGTYGLVTILSNSPVSGFQSAQAQTQAHSTVQTDINQLNQDLQPLLQAPPPQLQQQQTISQLAAPVVVSAVSYATQINVSFNAVPGATGYLFYIQPVNGNLITVQNASLTQNGSTVTLEIPGLNPSTNYIIRVYSSGQEGWSPNYAQITAYTEVAQPSTVMHQASPSNSAASTFTAQDSELTGIVTNLSNGPSQGATTNPQSVQVQPTGIPTGNPPYTAQQLQQLAANAGLNSADMLAYDNALLADMGYNPNNTNGLIAQATQSFYQQQQSDLQTVSNINPAVGANVGESLKIIDGNL